MRENNQYTGNNQCKKTAINGDPCDNWPVVLLVIRNVCNAKIISKKKADLYKLSLIFFPSIVV